MEVTDSNSSHSDEVKPPLFQMDTLLYWVLALFAVFGFLYNIAQLPNSDDFFVHLVDVVVVSYTNLLALPFLAYVTFTKRRHLPLFESKGEPWGIFLAAPFCVVFFEFIFRLIERAW